MNTLRRDSGFAVGERVGLLVKAGKREGLVGNKEESESDWADR